MTKKMIKTFPLYALILILVMGLANAYGEENASNPLASVNNIDVRYQYFDLDGPERNDFWLDGAYMLTPKLKLKYELHYWDTNPRIAENPHMLYCTNFLPITHNRIVEVSTDI